MNPSDRIQGLDLMRFAVVRSLIRSPWFPHLFQLLFLMAFICLAVLGWQQQTPTGVASKLYAKANLVNLVIWGLWWPAMVWTAVLLGRVWCLGCPLELVSNAAERLSRWFGWRQGRLKRWMATGSLTALFYLLTQLWVAGAELHRVPALTSLFLWILLAAALLTGLLLKDRAFCRGFCPVGLLLNVYGRGGAVAIRPKERQPCRECTGRECKVEGNRHALDARSCPSLLDPARLDTNEDCLVCGQCLKACRPANLALLLRMPFAQSDARPLRASWPVTLFVMVLSGFVTYELFSEWKAAQAIFMAPVDWFCGWVGIGKGATGWIKGIYTLLVVPAGLWFLAGGLSRLLGGGPTLGESWRRLALPLAIVIAGGHMAKGLAKIVSWGGFLPGAVREPLGLETVRGLSEGTLSSPTPWLSLSTVSAIGVALVLGATWLGIREAALADGRSLVSRTAPVAALGVFYLFLVAGWGLQ